MDSYTILKQIISRISILEQTLISQTNAFYQMNSTYMQMVTFLQTLCGMSSAPKPSLPQSFNFNSFEPKPFEFTLKSSLKMPQDTHDNLDKKEIKIPFAINKEIKEEDLFTNYFSINEEISNDKKEQKVLIKQKTPSFGQMNEYIKKIKENEKDLTKNNKNQDKYINSNINTKVNNFISEHESNSKDFEGPFDFEEISNEINPQYLKSNETFTNDIQLCNNEEIIFDSKMNLTKSDKSIMIQGKNNNKERESCKKKERSNDKKCEHAKDDDLLSKSMINGKKLSSCSTKNKKKIHPVRKTIKLASPQRDKNNQKLEVNIFQNKKAKKNTNKEQENKVTAIKEKPIVNEDIHKEHINIPKRKEKSSPIFHLPESCIIILFEFMGESISPLGFTCKIFLEFLSKSSFEIAQCALQHLESEKTKLVLINRNQKLKILLKASGYQKRIKRSIIH